MIYLIGGPPRCGKTTLAKALSKKLKISWISADALECASRPYVPKKNQKKKYPYSYLRGHGKDRNNDEFYSIYSTTKIISVLKKQAKTVETAVEMFIAHELDNHNDYIIEGYHITPAFRTKMVKTYGKKNIRTVFLTKFDAEQFAKDVHKSSTPNDWLLVLTKKEETFLKVGKMVAKYSEYFEKEAKKFKLKTVNMDKNFSKQIKEAVKLLQN
jgi:2-phosphoglycerate kinase